MPRTLKADDATEVALASKGTVLPVDDETNFGPLTGKKKSVLAPEALAMDPRALAKKLAANAGRLPPTRTPTPRRRREGRRLSLEEDEPTQLGETTGFSSDPTEEEAFEAPPPPKPPEQVDPRELARRLAAEAKQKIAREQAAAPSEPDPPPPPAKSDPPEDPAALARRLAAEARARIEKERSSAAPQSGDRRPTASPSRPPEDPAALARRLAAEAKARLDGAAAEAQPPAEAPAAPEPDAPPAPEAPPSEVNPVEAAASAPPPAEEPTPKAPAKVSRLASRAPRTRKATSAKEALQAALKRPSKPAPAHDPKPPAKEEARLPPADSATVVAPPRPTAQPTKPAVTSQPPRPAPSTPPRPKKSRSRPPTPPYLVALRELLPGAKIERERPVLKPAVFTALWEAHQARAVKDNHLELAASAGVLLARVAGESPGAIIGIQLSHKKKSWAAFVDRSTGAVLAIVPEPAIYLAGLQ